MTFVCFSVQKVLPAPQIRRDFWSSPARNSVHPKLGSVLHLRHVVRHRGAHGEDASCEDAAGERARQTAGCSADDSSVRRAVKFLLSKQNSNGGSAAFSSSLSSSPDSVLLRFFSSTGCSWGESYRSCVDKAYDGSEVSGKKKQQLVYRRVLQEACYGRGGSGVVQTAWALLGLMAARVRLPEEVRAVEEGIKFLMSMQTAAGDWEQVKGKGREGKVLDVASRKALPGSSTAVAASPTPRGQIRSEVREDEIRWTGQEGDRGVQERITIQDMRRVGLKGNGRGERFEFDLMS
eukprot:762514-Hanusia_phi.AAC.3